MAAPVAVNHVSAIATLDDSHDSWSSLELDDHPPTLPSSPSRVSESPPAPPAAPPAPTAPVRLQSDRKKTLKRKVQGGIQQRVNDFWSEKVGQYVMQGDYLALVMEEWDCVTWRAYMWDIPCGVLKFAINAGINTLPTFDNLKRWGKRTNDRCPFCGNIQTLLHVLSNCGVALDQGRYTWRHNSVLATIIRIICPALFDGTVLYSDMPEFQAPHGGTIPPDLLVTNLKPDLFIFNEVSRFAVVFELTCPWDANIERSHSYKEEKYAALVADLSRNYKVFHFSVEISVRGHVTKANKNRLKSLAYKCCNNAKQTTKSLINSASKAALLSSYSIFSARKEPAWMSPAPLIVK